MVAVRLFVVAFLLFGCAFNAFLAYHLIRAWSGSVWEKIDRAVLLATLTATTAASVHACWMIWP